jgi:hypothetical protein
LQPVAKFVSRKITLQTKRILAICLLEMLLWTSFKKITNTFLLELTNLTKKRSGIIFSHFWTALGDFSQTNWANVPNLVHHKTSSNWTSWLKTPAFQIRPLCRYNTYTCRIELVHNITRCLPLLLFIKGMESSGKVCPICQDEAPAEEPFRLNYGAVCCWSCRAFFRRAHQRKDQAPYTCKTSEEST